LRQEEVFVPRTKQVVSGTAMALLALTVPLVATVPSHAGSPAVRTSPNQQQAAAPPKATTAQPSAAQISAAKQRITQLNRQLRALAPYVRVNRDGTEALSVSGARRARFSEPLIALAAELVTYQNALLRKARRGRYGGPLPSAALADYPRVRDLFSIATTAAIRQLRAQNPKAPKSSLDVTAIDPCGDWHAPLPTSNPPRSLQGPYADVPGTLRRTGYHRTAGYACGHPSKLSCRGDYTRPHRYAGPAGACAAPRFRDQAIPSSSLPGYVRVQYGEPNPEIAAYGWPYWSWGAYVVWWHRNY
jgi:hypothetical protein